MTTWFATLLCEHYCDQRNQEDEIYLTPLLVVRSTNWESEDDERGIMSYDCKWKRFYCSRTPREGI